MGIGRGRKKDLRIFIFWSKLLFVPEDRLKYNRQKSLIATDPVSDLIIREKFDGESTYNQRRL